MNCDICHRVHHAQKLPFLCAIDARNCLYEGRLAHATALIENASLEQRINDSLSCPNPAAPDSPSDKTIYLEKLKAQEAQSADRTAQIIAQADKLQAEVEVARKEIEDRKKALARRKADLTEASNGIAARRTRQQEETERAVQMTKYKWNRGFENMAATRSFLCMEAARLYGLRRVVKKGAPTRYELGGVEMIELPAMITASPEVISTSLAHISHILMLTSHYLAIRLPAEITLPHRDYPRPTVFSLASSYRYGDVAFPGSSIVLPSEPKDPDQKHVPRPRPLYIDKPLLTLAKDDPVAYSLFIEGVVLLAYDIAWACSTQGVSIGDKASYEDVCNMGRNLYHLLIGNQLANNPAARFVPSPSPDNNTPDTRPNNELGNTKPLMGRYSHGTAHTFLGSAEGNEFMRSFKLPNPVKLADRLKKKLMNDVTNLDWEMLEDDAWLIEEPMESGVIVKGRQADNRRLFGVESVMSTRTNLESTVGDLVKIPSNDGSPEKARGTNGWTKLKPR